MKTYNLIRNRKLIIKVLIACLFFLSVKPVFAAESPSTFLIVNQVRGSECCEPGSVTAVQSQLKTLRVLELPATFALRYDTLQDSKYQQTFQTAEKTQTIELAAFLEITPQLAEDAGVTYRGPIERWYKAQNAYLLGYEVTDRQKLIDAYFTQFHQVYGQYPQTTVGWLIDAWSLKYLVEKYHVTAHQITREQWGTDSYTLYGGPVATPYFPSQNWPLVPGQTTAGTLPIVIFRQTINDTLLTYGDDLSVYTSQPNDYLRVGLDLSYFQHLIGQTIKGSYPFGFGAVGLENSMAENYQQEFLQQLQLMKAMAEKNLEVQISTASEFSQTFLMNYPNNHLHFIADQSANQDQTAFWVTTPYYRARVIFNRGQVWLSDLRIYQENWQDPYATQPTGSPNAYWVVPFFIDSSRYYHKLPISLVEQIRELGREIQARLKKQTQLKSEHFFVNNDFAVGPIGLKFPDHQTKTAIDVKGENEVVKVQYQTPTSETVELSFQPHQFQVTPTDINLVDKWQQQTPLKNFLTTAGLELQTQLENQTLTFTPKLTQTRTLQELQTQYPTELAPETIQRAIVKGKTQIIYSNRSALVGRNPIRIVVRFRDELGLPTLPQQELQVKNGTEDFDQVTIQHPETAAGEYYLDITQPTAGTYTPILKVDGEDWSLQSIRFVTDCKAEKLSCLKKPVELWHFISTKLQDVLAGR